MTFANMYMKVSSAYYATMENKQQIMKMGDSELLLTIPSIDSSDKSALERAVTEKSAIDREKSAIEARVDKLRLSAPTREKVLLLLKSFGVTRQFGRTDVVAVAHVKYSNAGSLLSLLREHALIVPVLGEGKGKYRFNV